MTSVALLLMSSTIYAVSIDCPNLRSFAFGLGMQSKQQAIWTQLQGDCCTASSITCDGSQHVTHIDWGNMNLNGFINGTAIPSNVMYLWLYGNVITGNIPSGLPSGLILLIVHGNQMSGDLPSFPSTLTNLALGYPAYPGNYFTGTLRLNRPIVLLINHNLITDVVIQDSSQIDLYWCDLSNNPLLGNLNIVGLTMCTKNNIYSSAVNLGMMIRCIISAVVLTTTLNKSPFKREFNKSGKTKPTMTSESEFK